MKFQDIEQLRQQMEENILLQIQTNEKILQDSKISWYTKVLKFIIYNAVRNL